MSEQPPASPAPPEPATRAFRLLTLVAAFVGVAALAAATFVLSYGGIHAMALQAGVATKLARVYPLAVDVLLVIVLAAVVSLRSAGWPAKALAWLCLLVVLGGAATADALHAAGRRVPAGPAAVTAAILPWALLLIGVGLLVVMLRHAGQRPAAAASAAGHQPRPVTSIRNLEPQPRPPLPKSPLVPGFGFERTMPEPEPLPKRTPRLAFPAEPPAADPALGPNDTIRLVVPRQPVPSSVADSTTRPVRRADERPSDAADERPSDPADEGPPDASGTAPDLRGLNDVNRPLRPETAPDAEVDPAPDQPVLEQATADETAPELTPDETQSETSGAAPDLRGLNDVNRPLRPETAPDAAPELSVAEQAAPEPDTADELAPQPGTADEPEPDAIGTGEPGLDAAASDEGAPEVEAVNDATGGEPAVPGMPVFHQMWSTSPKPGAEGEEAAPTS